MVVGEGINASCASAITETHRIATVGSLLVRKGRMQLSARVSYAKYYSRRIDIFLLAQPSRFMTKSIDLPIGRMQQRQSIARQVNTSDDLQPARDTTFGDRLCATFHRPWRFQKEATYTTRR